MVPPAPNAGWNASCWVLLAGHVSSLLFVIAAIANPRNARRLLFRVALRYSFSVSVNAYRFIVELSGSSGLIVRCWLICSFFQGLVPSMVFTACHPYNKKRNGRKTHVIYIISVFSIVSCNCNRDPRCWAGVVVGDLIAIAAGRRNSS